MRSLDVFDFTLVYEYCKVASYNMSRLEAQAGYTLDLFAPDPFKIMLLKGVSLWKL